MSQPPPGYPAWQEGQGGTGKYDDGGDKGLLSNVLGGGTSGQQYGGQGYQPQQGYGSYYGQSQPGYGSPGYNQSGYGQPGNTPPQGSPGYNQSGYGQPGNASPQGYTSSGYALPSGGYSGQSLNPSQGQPYAPPQQGYGGGSGGYSGGYAPSYQQNTQRVQGKHHNLAGPALAALGGAAVGVFAEHEHDKHKHHHRHD